MMIGITISGKAYAAIRLPRLGHRRVGMCAVSFVWREKEPSIEHVFPEAIGGTLETERVCTGCNSFLGHKVDVLLTDHPAILRKRHEFGMTTSAGKPVDPMGKLFRQGTLASDPEKRIQTVVDPGTGKIVPKMMYHRRRTKNEDGTESVQITLDESDMARWKRSFSATAKARVLSRYRTRHFRLLSQMRNENANAVEQPEVVVLQQDRQFHYQRAICKIAYELACIWIGDAYLDDRGRSVDS